MKQFSFIFLLITLSTIKLLAQDVCGTPAPAPPSWIFGTPTTSQQRILQSSNTDSYTLNIYLHIVRSSSGSGLNTSISSSIISLLNTNFLGSRIQFNLLGCDYINDNNYYNDCSKKESQLCAVNNIPNAINIYVLGTSTVWNYGDYPYLIPLAGNASSIPSTSLILSGNSYNTLTLPHEMGHCLGLFHTFHGTVREVGSLYTTDDSQCAELVNGGNSATCGDYISDTPADPNKWSNCTYNGSIQDANGDSYKPDPRNIMSYSGNSCRNLFTAIQSERMRNFILNTPALQNAIHREVSGPSQICTQGTYTIDVAGATVVWSATPSGVVSLQPNGSSVTLTKVGSGNVTLSALINNSIAVTKDIWVGGPKLLSYTTTPKQLCGGEPFMFNAVIPDGCTITSATGLSEGVEIPLSVINSASYEVPADVSRITLSIENSCGDVTVRKLIPKANCLNFSFSMSPNPASNNTMISLTSTANVSAATLPCLHGYISVNLLAQKCGLVGGICNSTFLYYEDFKSDRQIVLL
jgi:hypothetical protein